MMNFQDMLGDVKKAAEALAAAAGSLPNQNLADIIKAGIAKLDQASQHPDAENVSADAVRGHVFGDEAQERLPFDPLANPSEPGAGSSGAGGQPGA